MGKDSKELYAEKLLDPRWQRKRLVIFERDNWTCQSCNHTDRTLCVHHKVYRGKDPWDAKDEDLVTLCSVCHEYELTERKACIDRLVELLQNTCLIDDIDSITFIIGMHYDRKHLKEWMDNCMRFLACQGNGDQNTIPSYYIDKLAYLYSEENDETLRIMAANTERDRHANG
jgi:hypothetical protein